MISCIISYMISCMIWYMISHMILHHLSNASILDASVTIQELCTGLLDTSTNHFCTSDRIHLVCPVQLFPWRGLDTRRLDIP